MERSQDSKRGHDPGLGSRALTPRSETDADSLTSYTTLQSHRSSSSYLSHPHNADPSHPAASASTSPSPRLASFSSHAGPSHLRPPYRSTSSDAKSASQTGSPGSPLRPAELGSGSGNLRQRTLSSSSSQFQYAPGPFNGSALGLTVPLSDQRRRSSATSQSQPQNVDKEQRRQRREARRAEKAERSTLMGEGYDSPLRRFIRGLSVRERSRWGLPIGLIIVGGIKFGVARNIRAGEPCRVVP